jgi:hypothetical protein
VTGEAISAGHDDAINGALLTRDESRILSWSEDNTLRLWDAVTGKQIGSTMRHDGSVNGALLSKEKRRTAGRQWPRRLLRCSWEVCHAQEYLERLGLLREGRPAMMGIVGFGDGDWLLGGQ